MDALSRLNALAQGEARDALRRCCGATRWLEAMVAGRPYAGREALFAAAERAWWSLAREDWLEAFRQHPKIGDADALRTRFPTTAAWAASEQGGVRAAGEATLDSLGDGNRSYQARFGYIFIVCASGKSAEELLGLLRARLGNAPDDELRVAAFEHAKITRIRLEKLLEEAGEEVRP
jgi:2-oxo-4-hydroxy-4-carboxy-5-ureidoimidazoline decarboxylase